MGRRPLCAACLFLMAGMYLAGLLGVPLSGGNPLPEPVQSWISRNPKAVICGEVQRSVCTEYSQSVYLKNVCLIVESKKISIENVRVYLKKKEEISVGASLLVSGTLEPVGEARNPGEFDPRIYYACQHIFYFMKNAVIEEQIPPGWSAERVRDAVKRVLGNSIQQCAGEDAPVFQAMVLGDRENLEEEDKLRYQMAGISHILAISGLHISLLGTGLYRLLKRTGIGIWPSALPALLVMVQYGLMTGGGVSTMRAVTMFFLAVVGEMLGRIYDGMTALALAAILLLVDSPANLYSSGFLLSFGAVLGIGVVSPALISVTGWKNGIGKALLTSLGVQLTTLPVVLVFFGEVSLAGVFLNLIVLPTVGAVLLCGAAGGILGIFSVKAGWAVMLPGRFLLGIYGELGRFAGRLPICTWIAGAPDMMQSVGYYLLLGAGVALGCFMRKRKKMFPCAPLLLLVPALLILSLHPGGGLKITCLDVGQGDAVVIETPEKMHVLIDGGSSSKSRVGEYQLMPYLKDQGISSLEAVVISHTDMDHISGLTELLEYIRGGLTSLRVKKLIMPRWEVKNDVYLELETLARQAGAQVFEGKQGDELQVGSARFRVLAPEKGSRGENVNEDGLVLELKLGGFIGLFTGDIGQETEERLLDQLEDVDFLKVAHHGSAYSTCRDFLEKVKPEIGFISCSAANRYGHPSPDTVRRLEEAGCHLEYTMKNGAVSVLYGKDGSIKVDRFVP